MHIATKIVTKIFFLLGISFNIKYQRIYIKIKYNKLSKLVVIIHRFDNNIRDNNIEKITIVLVVISNKKYLFVNNEICLNSFFTNNKIIEIKITKIDSVK